MEQPSPIPLKKESNLSSNKKRTGRVRSHSLGAWPDCFTETPTPLDDSFASDSL